MLWEDFDQLTVIRATHLDGQCASLPTAAASVNQSTVITDHPLE
jgi:hypothetical protein